MIGESIERTCSGQLLDLDLGIVDGAGYHKAVEGSSRTVLWAPATGLSEALSERAECGNAADSSFLRYWSGSVDWLSRIFRLGLAQSVCWSDFRCWNGQDLTGQ